MPERQEGGADAWIKPDASAGEAAVELSMATPMRDVPVFFFKRLSVCLDGFPWKCGFRFAWLVSTIVWFTIGLP